MYLSWALTFNFHEVGCICVCVYACIWISNPGSHTCWADIAGLYVAPSPICPLEILPWGSFKYKQNQYGNISSHSLASGLCQFTHISSHIPVLVYVFERKRLLLLKIIYFLFLFLVHSCFACIYVYVKLLEPLKLE